MKTKTIERIEETIAKMIRMGKKRIYYAELINKCEVSPTYAREVLRSYALTNGFIYEKGYLFTE